MRIFQLLVFVFLVMGFSAQPTEERQAQDQLPRSTHATWKILSSSKVVVKKDGKISATISPEVQALDGKEIEISGFMLPTEMKRSFTHFLLALRTPTCPFCPPGSPTEMVEVTVTKPMEWDENLLTFKGIFHYVRPNELGVIYKMEGAERIRK